jgi:hypothetical protein
MIPAMVPCVIPFPESPVAIKIFFFSSSSSPEL